MIQKLKKIFGDFRTFAFTNGNILNLAVGVMIGGAFANIVSSLVNDLLMPIISVLTGRVDMSNMFIAMDGEHYATIAAATAAGVSTLNYGTFLQTVINFLLIAVCVFFLVRLIGKIARTDAKSGPPPCLCPFCRMPVDPLATRCPNCTSEIIADAPQES